MSDIAYLELDEIAAPKLAVDGEIEKGEISDTLGQLQSDPDRPDLSEFQWGLRPDQAGPCSRDCYWRGSRRYLRCCTWCASSILSGEAQVWLITIWGVSTPSGQSLVLLKFPKHRGQGFERHPQFQGIEASGKLHAATAEINL